MQIKLIVDGVESSAENLSELSFNDHAFDQPDTLDFSFYKLPGLKVGSEVELRLLIENSNDGKTQEKVEWVLGEFTITQLKHDLKTGRFSASGNKLTGWQAKISRAFSDVPLRRIVQTMASEMDLNPICDADFQVGFYAQSNLTNYQALHSLAQHYGCVFAVKGQDLLFTKQKDSSTQTQTLRLDDFSELNLTAELKERYLSVELAYIDTKTNSQKIVQSGRGGLVKKIRHAGIISEQEARFRADAFLKKLTSGTLTGSFSMPGRLLSAGSFFKIQSTAYEDSIFFLKTATHKFSPWQISGEFELAG